MIKKLLAALGLALGIASTAYAVTPFNSAQVATTSLSNGSILQTDGTWSRWIATSSLGFPVGITNAYASSTFASFIYGSSTYVNYGYGSSTFINYPYASTTFSSFGYGSSTYYFASNPSGYITSSALAPYVTFVYASSTFPTFTYASSTFASTSWITATFPSFAYATNTFETYAYATATRPTFAYASTTYVTYPYATSTFAGLFTNNIFSGTNVFNSSTSLATTTISSSTISNLNIPVSLFFNNASGTALFATNGRFTNSSSTNSTTTNFNLSGWFRDSLNATGTSGQYLLSTGTSTKWTSVSAGVGCSSVGSAGTVQFASSTAGACDGSSTLFVVDTVNGRIGIGTSSPYDRLSVAGNIVATGTIAAGDTAPVPLAYFSANKFGSVPSGTVGSQITMRRTDAGGGTNTGYRADIILATSTTMFNGIGLNFNVSTASSGATMSNGSGLQSSIANVAGATFGNAVVASFGMNNQGIGTLWEGVNLSIANSGTLTDTHGITVGDITSGTQTNNAIAFNSTDPNAWNYFAGNTGVGTSTPSQKLAVVGNIGLSGAFLDSVNATGTLGQALLSTGTSTLWSAIPTFSYGSSTYVTYPYASSTYPSFAYGSSSYLGAAYASSTFVNYPYASSTFPTYTYASTTFASTSWILATFPSFAYGTSTYVGYPYASSTFHTFAYASTTFPSFSYASSTYATGTNFWGGTLAGNIFNLNLGSIGIGTTTPRAQVHINSASTTNTTLAVQATPSQTGAIFDVWSGGGTSFMNVQPSGLIGLGTTTPFDKLDIIGSQFLSGAFKDSTGATGTLNQVLVTTGTSTLWTSTSTLFGIIGGLYTGVYPINVTGSLISTSFSTSTANSYALQQTFVNASATAFTSGQIFFTNATGTVLSSNLFPTGLTSSFLAVDSSGKIVATTTPALVAANNIFTGNNTFSGTSTFATTTTNGSSTFFGQTYFTNASTTAISGTGLTFTNGWFNVLSGLASSFVNSTTTNLNLSGWYRDSINATGTAGQVLTSSGTSTLWATISGSGITNAYASSTFVTYPYATSTFAGLFTANTFNATNTFATTTAASSTVNFLNSPNALFTNATSTNFFTTTGSSTTFRVTNATNTNLTVQTDAYFTSFTNGSIPFFSLSNGKLTQNNSNFFWDNTNFRLGIGTSAPQFALAVASGTIVGNERNLATSTSMTIDWKNGNQQLIRTGPAATTIIFVNATTTPGATLRLVVCNPPTGTAGALTWTQVYWPSQTAPTQTTSANNCDAWSFISTQSTSTTVIYGNQSAKF